MSCSFSIWNLFPGHMYLYMTSTFWGGSTFIFAKMCNLMESFRCILFPELSIKCPDHISVSITKLQIHISTENITFCFVFAFEKLCTLEHHSIPSSPQVEAPLITSLHKVWFAIFQWPISNVVARDCFYIKVW